MVETIHCVDYKVQKGINLVLYTYFYHLLIFQIVPMIVANRLRKMANSYDQVYHTVSVNLILVSQCRHRATRSITVWQSIALNPHIFPSEWFAFTHLCPSVELRGGRRKCKAFSKISFSNYLRVRYLFYLLGILAYQGKSKCKNSTFAYCSELQDPREVF